MCNKNIINLKNLKKVYKSCSYWKKQIKTPKIRLHIRVSSLEYVVILIVYYSLLT